MVAIALDEVRHLVALAVAMVFVPNDEAELVTRVEQRRCRWVVCRAPAVAAVHLLALHAVPLEVVGHGHADGGVVLVVRVAQDLEGDAVEPAAWVARIAVAVRVRVKVVVGGGARRDVRFDGLTSLCSRPST